MLIQFTFKNFRSFRDEVTLDLSATSIKENEDRVVSFGNEKLLTAAAIFGANASGKSNVQEAFKYMTDYVKDSFLYGGDIAYNDRGFNAPTPFLFDEESRNQESMFEVFFIQKEANKVITYQYGFCIDSKGISEEWLSKSYKTNPEFKTIFYRNREENELDLSGIPEKDRSNIETALEAETLIVSLGAKLKVGILKKVRNWFLENRIIDFGNPRENYRESRYLPKGFIDDENVRKDVVRYLSTFDNSIVDFEIENIDRDYFRLFSVHEIKGSGNRVAIPFEHESAGTLKMFNLYRHLHKVLSDGGLIFVDELNSRLHPLLLRNFLLSFLNPEINKNHAQIIFTSHDLWELSNNLLRRDEIWFTEKDSSGNSTLYSLADFKTSNGKKIRNDENFAKNYLLGKYGAIPHLSEISFLDEGVDLNGEE